jgi:hypothetical protein
MNFDGEDPNHLGQLFGVVQRNAQIKGQQQQMGLQQQILEMQKLQVLNQVRISKGLKPLSEPPKTQPAPTKTPKSKVPIFEYNFASYLLIVFVAGILIFTFYLLTLK